MLNQKNFKDLVEEFKTFHQKNPEVYKMFVQFTLQAINRGHTKLSSEMVRLEELCCTIRSSII